MRRLFSSPASRGAPARATHACLIVVVATFSFFIAPLPVFAASEGPNDPGTLANDASAGTVAWSNASNAASQNDTYASANLDADAEQTQYLKATDFGFAIPDGATIDGIIVEFDAYESAGGQVWDAAVRIVKGGTIGTDDKASVTFWPTSDADAYRSYGDSSDLWGETWTDDDINASDFGAAIRANHSCEPCLGFGDNTFIDHIRITVHYTEGGGGGASTAQTRAPLLVNTEAFDTIDDGNGDASALQLKFGYAANEKLEYQIANARFRLSRALKVGGALTVTGSLIVNTGRSTAVADAGYPLEVIGTASGKYIWMQKSVTGSFLHALTTFAGAGLVDCGNATTSKLLWNGATKVFSCGTDQAGGGSGLSQGAADARYVNVSGDVMTGALIISNGAGLTAAGSVFTNGNVTLNADTGSLMFGNPQGSKSISYINAASRFNVIGDLHVESHVSGSGTLDMNVGDATVDDGVFFLDVSANRVGILTLNPETALEVVGTASGRTLHAQDRLESSGSLVVNGTTSFNEVTYAWPPSAASGSGDALKVDPATGQLTWGDDRGMLTVIKPVNESTSSDTTLTDDTHLKTPITANTAYHFTAGIRYTSGATGDFKCAFNAPASSVLRSECYGFGVAGSAPVTFQLGGDEVSALGCTTTTSAASIGFIYCSGYVWSPTDGTLAFQWAQNSNDATATTVKSGSILRIMRTNP